MGKIETLRRLYADATPGEWTVEEPEGTAALCEGLQIVAPGAWRPVAECLSDNMMAADAALIAAMHNSLPALVAVVEAAREVLPYLPDMEPTGARAMSSHAQAAWALRQAIAEVLP